MHFLRMYTQPTLASWDSFEDEPLAKKAFVEAFEETDNRPSLYSVYSTTDELCAAAAFVLTKPNIRLDSFFIIRIFGTDLEEFGLRVDDDQPGTTGVVDVDFRHFEICNLSKPKAVALTVHLRNTASCGVERFRWVASRFQREQFRTFLRMSDTEVIPEAKRRCRERLCCPIPSDSRGRSTMQIISDLDANLPTLPKFRVERAAFLNYCCRIQTRQLGNPEDDWRKGENDLRQAYKNAFC